jgi:hypothetical protein
VTDAVQGPFSAREMVGWVASGMLKDDTRACGADPSAGVRQRLDLTVDLEEGGWGGWGGCWELLGSSAST